MGPKNTLAMALGLVFWGCVLSVCQPPLAKGQIFPPLGKVGGPPPSQNVRKPQDVHAVLNHLAGRIGVSHRRRDNLKIRIARAQEQVQRTKNAFLSLGIRQQQTKEELNAGILQLYRVSKQSLGGAFFSFVNSPYFLKYGRYAAMVHQEQFALIDHYAKSQKSIQKIGFERRDALNNLQELEAALKNERQRLYTQTKHLRKILVNLRSDDTLRQRRSNQLLLQANQASALLLDLEKTSPALQKKPSAVWHHPVDDATVIRHFGDRKSYLQEEPLQDGVLLRSQTRPLVKAMHGGVVALSAPFYGQGDMLVIYHGSGVYGVYGHLENIRVQPGQWIKAGDTLGDIAYQPLHNDHWLYLGLREQGRAQDPLLILPSPVRPVSQPRAQPAFLGSR